MPVQTGVSHVTDLLLLAMQRNAHFSDVSKKKEIQRTFVHRVFILQQVSFGIVTVDIYICIDMLYLAYM